MKKKWKITIAIVLALILGAGAYLTYIFKFKEYDVADDEVEEIIANPYEVELPDGSKLVIGEDGTVNELDGKTIAESDPGSDSVEEESEEETDGSGQSTSGSNKTAGVTPPKTDSKGTSTSTNQNKKPVSPAESKKLTVAEVKGKYEPVFRQLEGQADEKIGALIGRAKKEYSDKKANGESISYGYFYNKYMGAANNMEANTDTAFYGVIKALENDLTANGYNKSYAQSFIDEYEAMKKARRDGILKRAMGQ